MKINIKLISILFVAFVAVGGFFAVADTAHAEFVGASYDYNTGGYEWSGGCCDYGYYPTYDTYYIWEPEPYYPSYDSCYDCYYPTYDYYYDYYYEPPIYIPPVQHPNPPTCSLSATQTSVTAGTPVTLSWTAGNATSGTISHVGSVSPSFGSRTVTPQFTTTYIGTFTGQGGSTTCQTTVVVQPKTPPTCSLTATPGHINSGDSASLIWSTSGDVTSMHISNIGSVSTFGGSRIVSPTNSTTYVATVSGPGGSATCQAPITVISQVPSCTVSVTQNIQNPGDPATLTWSSQNATSVNITNVGSVSTSGSRTVFPGQGTTTYVATATGSGGTATCQTTTHVNIGAAPFCTLTANPSSVQSGSPVTLTWTTNTGATSFFINNSVGFVNTGSGSRTIIPNSTITYTGTVQNSNGQSATCVTTVGVFSPNVTLLQQPGNNPLASVSLTQVPYTGFSAGPTLTFVFWFMVALWSAGIAYIFVGRQGIQFIAERLFAFDMAVANGYQTQVVDMGTREDEYVNGHTYAEPAVQSQMAVEPEVETVHGAPIVSTPHKANASVAEEIESRAHAAGVLMSPEAVVAAEKLSDDRENTLEIFGNILNEISATIPSEDGWKLVSSDTFEEIAKKYTDSAKDEVTPSNETQAPELSSDNLAV